MKLRYSSLLLWVLALSLSITPSFAAQTQSMEDQYLNLLSRENEQLAADKQLLKELKYPGCENVQKRSDCFRIFLSKSPPRSSAGFVLRNTLSTSLVLADSAAGLIKAPWAVLSLADAHLDTIEATDTSKFHLSKLKATSSSDDKDLRFMVSKENETLRDSYAKDLSEIENILNTQKMPPNLRTEEDKRKWQHEWELRQARLQKSRERGLPQLTNGKSQESVRPIIKRQRPKKAALNNQQL